MRRGSYSPSGRSEDLLETPAPPPLLRTPSEDPSENPVPYKAHYKTPSRSPSEMRTFCKALLRRVLRSPFSEPCLGAWVVVRHLRRAPKNGASCLEVRLNTDIPEPEVSKRGWRTEGVGARKSFICQRFRPLFCTLFPMPP